MIARPSGPRLRRSTRRWPCRWPPGRCSSSSRRRPRPRPCTAGRPPSPDRGPRPPASCGSGGSSTPFTVVLPANASCSGDTAHDGYHVYSYLVPRGTDLVAGDLRRLPVEGLRAGRRDRHGTTERSTPPSTPARSSASPTTSYGERWSGRPVAPWPSRRWSAEPSHGGVGGRHRLRQHPRPARPTYWNTQVTFTADARRRPWVRLAGGARGRPPGPSSLPATGTAAGAAPASAASTRRRRRPAAAAGPRAHGATAARLDERRVRRSGPAGRRPAVSAAHRRRPMCRWRPRLCAGALALAAGLLLLVRRNRRAGPTPAVRGSLR